MSEYHLRPDGNDSADGLSFANGWATFENADSAMGPGDTLLVHAGTYVEWVRWDTSGTLANPITIQAAGGKLSLSAQSIEMNAETEIKVSAGQVMQLNRSYIFFQQIDHPALRALPDFTHHRITRGRSQVGLREGRDLPLLQVWTQHALGTRARGRLVRGHGRSDASAIHVSSAIRTGKV